jgi:hypothetical protein
MLYRRRDAEVRLRFGADWSLDINEELLRELRRWLGADAVQLRFRPPERDIEPARPELAYSGG